MNEKQREALLYARDLLKAVADESNDNEYLETGDALDAMEKAYNAISALFAPPEPVKVCTECGSQNVEISLPAWFNVNTLEQTGTDDEADPLYTWCHDCDESRRGDWTTTEAKQ